MTDLRQVMEMSGESGREMARKLAMLGGVFVYVGAMLVSLFRNIDLFSGTFRNTGIEWFAILGVVILTANGMILPLFIHFRASGFQLIAAIIFYIIDLSFLFMNSLIDSTLARSGRLVGFYSFYYENVAFATPVFIMAGWSLLFVLDPASRFSPARLAQRFPNQ